MGMYGDRSAKRENHPDEDSLVNEVLTPTEQPQELATPPVDIQTPDLGMSLSAASATPDSNRMLDEGRARVDMDSVRND